MRRRTETAFAPAKVNLALHVTGRRDDGYHLLDSLVMFADFGDTVTVTRAVETSLTVTGPMAAGVPADARNLCWQVADRFGEAVAITLDKRLPAAAGIGGGSSDAAATLRALEALTGRAAPFDPLDLGADVPVCRVARAARMQGIGDVVRPLFHATPVPAVLVNPGVAVPTGVVFGALRCTDNPSMTDWPEDGGFAAMIDWLTVQRNDLEGPAIALQPVVIDVLTALSDAALARMSGSGATCFGLYETRAEAETAAGRIGAARPGWWVAACSLR